MEIDKASYEIDMLTAEIMLATMIYKKTKEIADRESSQVMQYSILVASIKKVLHSVKSNIALEHFLSDFCNSNPYGVYNYQHSVHDQLSTGNKHIELWIDRRLLTTFIENCKVRLYKLRQGGKIYSRQDLMKLLPRGQHYTLHRRFLRLFISTEKVHNFLLAKIIHKQLKKNEYDISRPKYRSEIRGIIRTINEHIKVGNFMINPIKFNEQHQIIPLMNSHIS